jgi:TonB-dependent starch-binding outer membrane protein SusC
MVLSLMFGLLFSVCAFAQQPTSITGKVIDENGQPVIGANVVVKGTTNGTVTDMDGNFNLNASQGSTLTFSYIGYSPVSILARPQMTVTLKENSKVLNDVVVIGYGTVKKSDATGSVLSIKADQLNKGLAVSPADMLEGKTPGVEVVNNSGAPGAGSTIRIRGGSSLSASNDPLIVVDGLPISSSTISGMSDVLSSINPNDIESFSVLKDASATAIYGCRASNGVIVITTKKGTSGKPKITLDMTGSVNYLNKEVDVMNANTLNAFLKSYLYDQIASVDGSKVIASLGNSDTDWQKQIYRTSWTEETNASVTGGMKGNSLAFNGLPYRFSIGYLNDDGILKTSNMQRSNLSLNLSPQFFDKHLTVNLNGKGIFEYNRFANTDAVGQAVAYDPTQSVYDSSTNGILGYKAWRSADGTPNTMATENPLALLTEDHNESYVRRFVGNAVFDYKFFYIPGLRANLNLGMDISSSNGSRNTPVGSEISYHDKTQNGSGLHTDYTQTRRDLSLEYYMNYVKELPSIESKFDIMGGYSWQHFFNSTTDLEVKQSDRTSVLRNSPSKTESYLVSFYGRFNYSLMDRYLLTFTLRDDGTSRFQNNKWGLFPSAAFAWRMSEEPFMKNVNWLSNLKLRLSYGVTGQQNLNVGDYPSIPTYHYNQGGSYYWLGNSVVQPITPYAYVSDLKWESTKTYNVGLDFGFFKDRISGSFDAYVRKTNNLINYVPIPAGTNLSNYVTMNVGDLKNTGMEFSLNVVPVQTKDWNWNVGYNISWNKNKITKLTQSDNPDYIGVTTGGISGGTGNTIQLQKVGEATNSFFVFQQVYDQNGKPIDGAYVDRNGDGQINDKDKYICHHAAPDVLIGFNTTLSYKKWTISAAARASFGNYVYNNVASNYEPKASMWAASYVANRLNSAIGTNFEQPQYLSDYYIKNASFVKLDRVTLSYQLANFVNLHATMQNVFTITKYKGLDPEVFNGIDNNMYPRPKTFLLGATFNF